MTSAMSVVLLLFVLCYSTTTANPALYQSELETMAHKEFKMLMDYFTAEKVDSEMPGDGRMLGRFHYENCAAPSNEVVVFKDLTIKPDPIELPGTINISFDSIIKAKFGSPLKARVEVYKEFAGHWFLIPCLDEVGSCTYDDVCKQLAKSFKTCPPALVKQGFNCRCPISPGKLSLKDYPVFINHSLPPMAAGDVKVRITMSSGNTLITCVQMIITLA